MNPVRSGRDSKDGMPHVEVPLKDMRPANADQTAANLAESKRRGRPFQKGNRVGGRKLALTGLGIASAGIPELARRELRKAESYRQRRVRELRAVHGYVSAGAEGLLGSAALVLASSKAVASEAFRTGNVELHELASRLIERASQIELKAEFLAKSDAAAKPRSKAPNYLQFAGKAPAPESEKSNA
jgi:hypothetical protein